MLIKDVDLHVLYSVCTLQADASDGTDARVSEERCLRISLRRRLLLSFTNLAYQHAHETIKRALFRALHTPPFSQNLRDSWREPEAAWMFHLSLPSPSLRRAIRVSKKDCTAHRQNRRQTFKATRRASTRLYPIQEALRQLLTGTSRIAATLSSLSI